MVRWRKRLFAVLNRNSAPATSYFRLPPAQTLGVNAEVEL
jgi:K+ transporter